MADKDGEAAFPQPIAISPADDIYHTELPGMSLHQYIATAALVGLIEHYRDGPQSHSRNALVRSAYDYADDMIAEYERRTKEPDNAI